MRQVKSERLKKLELDLHDLEQWMELGLVPKKDLKKHVEEIQIVKDKIEEEKERLRFLKESGEVEEFVAPKRTAARTAYTEMPTLPDIDIGDQPVGELHHDLESETVGAENSIISEREGDEEEGKGEEEEEESYFSDKSRWRRGGIPDPDADEW